MLPFLKSVVKNETTDLTSHGGLGQQGNSLNRIRNLITGFLRVLNFVEKNTINLNLYVIFGNCSLAINFKNSFLKVMMVCNYINKWNFKVKTGTHLSKVPAETLNDHNILLWHHNNW